ncbi:MAG: ABC-2 transporter permease [Coprococcus sp.]|nr:ABC-2 transporter permease [Coprococcus sp.]
MKGLLIKDFMFFKNQKQLLGIALFMTVILMVSNRDASFAIGYGMVMLSTLVITSISYDKYEKGMSYLFTLPVSRKKYVQEKYVLAIMMLLLALAAIAVILTVVINMKLVPVDMEELLLTLGACGGMALLMDFIMIPLQLKFESERMQSIYIAVFGVVFVAIYAVLYIVKKVGIDLEQTVSAILTANLATVVGVWILLIVVVLLISYLASQRIMRKKDF